MASLTNTSSVRPVCRDSDPSSSLRLQTNFYLNTLRDRQVHNRRDRHAHIHTEKQTRQLANPSGTRGKPSKSSLQIRVPSYDFAPPPY